MDGGVFPDDRPGSDPDPAGLRFPQRLMQMPDDRADMDLALFGDLKRRGQIRVRPDLDARADPNRAFDNGVRPDLDVGINLRARVNDCCGMNVDCLLYTSPSPRD